MGNTQGRSEDFENEEENGIIKVSDSVATRILMLPETKKRESKPSKEKLSPRETLFEPKHPRLVENKTNESVFLSKKEQVRLIEDYYQNQLQLLKKQNEDLKDITKNEYNRAMKEIEDQYKPLAISRPICKGMESVVVECYKENAKSPLNCSHEVKKLVECVQKHNHNTSVQ